MNEYDGTKQNNIDPNTTENDVTEHNETESSTTENNAIEPNEVAVSEADVPSPYSPLVTQDATENEEAEASVTEHNEAVVHEAKAPSPPSFSAMYSENKDSETEDNETTVYEADASSSLGAFGQRFRKKPVYERRYTRWGRFRSSRYFMMLFVVFGALVVAVTVFFILQNFRNDTAENIRTVISTIQSTGRLETARVTPERIYVDVERLGNSSLPGIDGATVSLIASGEVTAGIDLAKLTADAVLIEGRNVRIRLPGPEILTWKLNNNTTRVLERTRGAFRQQDDLDLERVARQRAEMRIVHIACETEILARATEDAVNLVEDIIANVDGAANFTFDISVDAPDTERCDRVAGLIQMWN